MNEIAMLVVVFGRAITPHVVHLHVLLLRVLAVFQDHATSMKKMNANNLAAIMLVMKQTVTQLAVH